MKKIIFSILLCLVLFSGYTQNLIQEQRFSTELDEIIETGIEYNSNQYLFIKRFGTYKDTVTQYGQFPFIDVYDYKTELLVTDNDFHVTDSTVFDIPGYYTIAKKILIINDTIVVLGRAVNKDDFFLEHVFMSTFTNDFTPIQTSLLENGNETQKLGDAVINNKNEIICNITNKNHGYDSIFQGFLATNTSGALLNYLIDTTTPASSFMHYDKINNRYQLIDNYVANIYDSNFQKLYDTTINYPPMFLCFSISKDITDSTFLVSGLAVYNVPYSGFDIAYCMFNNNMEIIDSNYIFIPDTMDYAANSDFSTPDTLFLGGTVNTNWNPSFPPNFQRENHKVVIQCSNLNTDEIYWTKRYGGDANYMMKSVFATSDNHCVAMASYYDWQNNPVQERDIVLFKVDANGVITNTLNGHDLHQLSYSVYPNPGNGKMHVQNYTGTNNFILTLTDLRGNIVLRKNLSGKTATINTSNLSAGVYLYKIGNSKGENETGKWIKQ